MDIQEKVSLNQLETLGSLNYKFEDYLHTIPGHSYTNKNELKPTSLDIFQMNIGKWCNQACHHCHVNASPKRTEFMELATMEVCLSLISRLPQIQTVDITGGAPEGNPHFRYLVEEIHRLGKKIIDRCNLTILSYPGMEDLHTFLAEHKVEVFCSLPHFSSSLTNKQRGDGVFERSIIGLKKLNSVGYGKDLILNLVYNPTGLYLSSSQNQLEYEFKEVLENKFGIYFNKLFTINNMPINRFLDSLVRKGKFQEYMDILSSSFNPNTLNGLMCRNQISVGYDGKVYDCDFNQMLDLASNGIESISEFNLEKFLNRSIVTANHCFGCTAGSGSSCGGEIA